VKLTVSLTANMYKNFQKDIKQYYLGPSLHQLHKEGKANTDFGMDNSAELIDGGFGIYSTANMKKRIGPVKTEYFRIGLVRSGNVSIDIGLESFQPARNGIIFGFPGQVFSLHDTSPDFFCYYMLFNEKFVADSSLMYNRKEFPFLNYSGIQCFSLNDEDADKTEDLILKINNEIKNRKANIRQAIQLYIQLILLHAKRSYESLQLSKQETATGSNELFRRFIKLVGQHFLELHKVTDYAELLNVSSDHLNRTIKSQSDKTAHELIDDMILIEAKAYLLHTQLSIAEIAYKLEFSDPSHFNKFFKKQTGQTPQQYRTKSE
jgi:AraC family transcriptional regulator, transcriptional activator of pobA